MFFNIFIAILLILIVYVFYSIRDYFGHEPFKDYSNNSVPLMKGAFEIVRKNPGEENLSMTKFIKTINFYQLNFFNSPEIVRRLLKSPTK